MRKIVLLILILSFLVAWPRVEAGELTLLYSNDTGGAIDPCPT